MTFTNAEMLIANKVSLFRLSCKKRADEKGMFDILLDGREFALVYANDNASEMNALLAWLDMKHKEQILDNAEKKYLSAVIRPFRNKVKVISKGYSDFDKEFIAIRCKNGDETFLPWFKAGTMYKGMERYKRYTPKELGL